MSDKSDGPEFWVGARIRFDKEGTVEGFRSFTEDGERYKFAVVKFDDGEERGIDVNDFDESDIIDPGVNPHAAPAPGMR